MFDGVEVKLGPRCGGYHPVIQGLEAGQRVATAGAFLIDAETRLNSNVAASYFGAARTPSIDTDRRGSEPAKSPSDDSSEVHRSPSLTGLESLSTADRALAIEQKLCPVTGKPLGSMGTPPRVVVAGKTVFLCCKGCESAL